MIQNQRGAVLLDAHEVEIGAYVGMRRAVSAVLRGLAPRGGIQYRSPWDAHVVGACGEIAAAKFLGIYFPASFDTFGADLPGWEVRTRSDHGSDLVVTKHDSDETRYVLVTGQPPRMWVRGWLAAGEAKRPEWLAPHRPDPNNPLWFAPQSALHWFDQ